MLEFHIPKQYCSQMCRSHSIHSSCFRLRITSRTSSTSNTHQLEGCPLVYPQRLLSHSLLNWTKTSTPFSQSFQKQELSKSLWFAFVKRPWLAQKIPKSILEMWSSVSNRPSTSSWITQVLCQQKYMSKLLMEEPFHSLAWRIYVKEKIRIELMLRLLS